MVICRFALQQPNERFGDASASSSFPFNFLTVFYLKQCGPLLASFLPAVAGATKRSLLMRVLGFATVILLVGGIGSAARAVPVFTDLNATTPEALAANLLAPNSGISINSVTYTGANAASGLFANGRSSNLGIDQGVVLTTGILSDMDENFSSNNVALGNPMLDRLAGQPTINASTLTIEFTPIGSGITFSYLFASREYPNFVNTPFADIFAFFVNGENRALIPGTSTPVGINTVNCGDAFGNNPVNCDLFNDNRNGDITDLDIGGFTDVFGLVADVTPGVINTLILTIADVDDPFFDSAVFLRSGSFASCGVPGLPNCNGNGEPPPPPPPPPPPGPVPEPGTIGILGLAVLGIAGLRRASHKR